MLILFDFDGTLADTTPLQLEIVRDILVNKYGYTYTNNEYDKILQMFRDKGPLSVMAHIKFPIFKYPELLKAVKDAQVFKMRDLKILPEMKSVLMEVKNIWKMGILSAGDTKYIDPFIKNNNLTGLFDYIYTDDNTNGKEKLFKRFLEETKLDPKEIVYVGDEIGDVKIAKKFGVKIIGVTWGVNSKTDYRKKNQIK